MPRGQKAEDGATFVNANGYHYTKVDGVWRPTAHIIAQQKLGRPLNNTDMVRFADGDRSNLEPDNIVVQKRIDKKSKEAKIALLQSRIADLEAELKLLLEED